MGSSDPADSALAAITKFVNEELAKEGITEAVLAAVDLDFICSPVMPHRGAAPHEATLLENGKYLVTRDPSQPALTSEVVSADLLRIMRARYILHQHAQVRPWLTQLIERGRERATGEGQPA